MKNGLTEARRTECNIYKKLETARKLQSITKGELAKALNVSGARVTQIYQDQSMSVKQMCAVLERLGLQIEICAR